MTSFRVNTPDVTHELVDGEVIVVHVNTGAYYSLNGSAATIWGWLDRGAGIDDMANRIAGVNDAERESILADLRRFTEDLQAEGLISTVEPANSMGVALDADATDGVLPFSTPKFEKYNDMEELLLVDPIHEVTPHGWPEKSPDNH